MLRGYISDPQIPAVCITAYNMLVFGPPAGAWMRVAKQLQMAMGKLVFPIPRSRLQRRTSAGHRRLAAHCRVRPPSDDGPFASTVADLMKKSGKKGGKQFALPGKSRKRKCSEKGK